MFGPITSLSITSKKLTLDDFRTLTVNRNVNKGTLVVRRDEENKIVGLECACHHDFLKSLNKPELITPATSKDLEEQFLDVVNRELDSIGDRLKKGVTVRTSIRRTNKVDEQIGMLKAVFADSIENASNSSDLKSLPRKTIGKLVDALDALNRYQVDDLETLTAEEMKAFVSGSWKVGDFNLTDLESSPIDTTTLNGVSGAIKTFIREIVPGTKKHAELLDRSEVVQQLIDRLEYGNFNWADESDDWRTEYAKWMTSLREELLGTLLLGTEKDLKDLFRKAFDECVHCHSAAAGETFGKMKKILNELGQEIARQRETRMGSFNSISARNGIDMELEDSMTVVMKLVADHGIKIDKNSVWEMFVRLERQDEGDWKLFKELGCKRLDTFVALRKLTKTVQRLVTNEVEQQPAEGNVRPSETEEERASAFDGALVLKYELKDFGSDATEGDAFDPAHDSRNARGLTEKNWQDRGVALAKNIWKNCKGKNIREAVCHVFNEFALRHRDLSAQEGETYRIRDYRRFLEEFAERFEDFIPDSMHEFRDQICGKLLNTKAWISDMSFQEDLENALDLLCAMYGEQKELQQVDFKGLEGLLGKEGLNKYLGVKDPARK